MAGGFCDVTERGSDTEKLLFITEDPSTLERKRSELRFNFKIFDDKPLNRRASGVEGLILLKICRYYLFLIVTVTYCRNKFACSSLS